MFGHRFAGHLEQRAHPEPLRPASFVVCPLGAYPGGIAALSLQQHLYQLALQEALAVAQPRRLAPESVFAWN